MSIEKSNAKIVSTCGQRLTALKKHMRTKTAMKVGGDSMKPSDLVTAYQAAIDTRAALIPQRAAYKKALAARNDAETTRQAIDKKLKAWVVNEYGADGQEAEEFGFLPAKVAETSVETKAAALLKLRATRKARGTLGKRQKAKIKGDVESPTNDAETTTTSPTQTAPQAPSNGAPPKTVGT